MENDFTTRVEDALAFVTDMQQGMKARKGDASVLAEIKRANYARLALIQTLLVEAATGEPIRCIACGYCQDTAAGRAYRCHAWHRPTDPDGYCYRRRIAEDKIPELGQGGAPGGE